MTTGSAGIKLIKKWESCKLESYLCPAYKWTIGFGFTDAVFPFIKSFLNIDSKN